MKEKEAIRLERKIAIGMIISTNYLKQVRELIDPKWVLSEEAKIIMNWSLQFYDRYHKAPKNHIQDIYFQKLRENRIQKDQAEIVESILESISTQSQKQSFNIEYLVSQTQIYCKSCKLRLYAEQIQDELDLGNVLEAEQLLSTYTPPEIFQGTGVIPLNTHLQVKNAFESFSKPLIHYPGALGNLLNDSMVKEGFVAFLGQNKGGKSFILQDATIRAATQGNNVIIFQAGDMSQAQTERRQAIYFARRSDLKKYCDILYIPVLDCIYNQKGTCKLDILEKDQEAPFEGVKIEDFPKLTYLDMVKAFKDFPDHVPCYNCQRTRRYSSFTGTIWFRKREPVTPLQWKEAWHLVHKKYSSLLQKVRLITYASETLTMNKINAEIDILEKQGFFANVILIDYLDLCAPDMDTKNLSIRDQENKKWQRARRLSQEKKCLLISASQSDAQGFNKKTLSKENFSEDRRKLDHVTAMFGLNMSIEEKKKGIMRINDIVGRDTEGGSMVNVLHRLQIGRPILGSFY